MFTAVIHEEDGIFIAECPEVGSVSQGTSMEEALSNLRERDISVDLLRRILRQAGVTRKEWLEHD